MKRPPLARLAQVLTLVLLARAAAAQTPAAPEFIVNTATLNAQDVPSLSMAPWATS